MRNIIPKYNCRLFCCKMQKYNFLDWKMREKMIEYYFENIRENLAEEILKAEFDLYVAVAWITDKKLWSILSEKAQNGLMVQVVLVPDDLNLNSGIDFDELTEKGIQIFWDDHHHKYCVIDRSTLITGSYNWTYYASKRNLRENIIVLKNEPKICKDYSAEFRRLLKESKKHRVKEKKVLLEKKKRKPDESASDKSATWFKTHKRRMKWWEDLDNGWKEVFRSIFNIEETPNEAELKRIFSTQFIDLSEFRITDIKGLRHLTNIQSLILPSDYKQ